LIAGTIYVVESGISQTGAELHTVDFALKGIPDNWRRMLASAPCPALHSRLGWSSCPHTPRWLVHRVARTKGGTSSKPRGQSAHVDDELISRPGTFWLYAAIGMMALLFFAVRVPETRNRELEDIEADLGVSRRRSKRNTI
jgi:hypothetical protein